MQIHLGQIKRNDKFHGKHSGFVDSGFVKTCDELVIGQPTHLHMTQEQIRKLPIMPMFKKFCKKLRWK